MPTPSYTSLSALLADFRNQVAKHALLIRDGADDEENVRLTYGPALEALDTPPPAKTPAEALDALSYLLDHGDLDPRDAAMIRAALAGLDA